MSPEPARDQERLESVRRELRRRGYLDSPLNRFLLREVLRRQVSRARAAFSLAGRVGLLGGPLVGVPVALATAAAAGGRGGLGGLALLALLLSVAFGIVLAALELLATLVLARWQRSAGGGPRLAARLAVAAGGLGVLYLGAWWRARRGDLGGAGWLDALSLVLITVLALGLTGLTRAAGALALAGTQGLEPRPSARIRRRRAGLLAAALAAAGSVLIFVGGDGPGPAPGRLPLTSPPGRLLVVGLDGLGQLGLADMQQRGLLPSLSELARDSARRPLARDPGLDPPAVWTTYATGVEPARHGVRGVEWQSLAGVPAPDGAGALVTMVAWVADALWPMSDRLASTRPVSARVRRYPTAWEIMGSQGIPVAVSHWWATSPAPVLPGCFASDRAFPVLAGGGPAAGDLAPAGDAAAWRAAFPAWLERHGGEAPGMVAGALLADRFHLEQFTRCWQAREPRAGFLYLWSLDVARAAAGGDPGQVLAAADRLRQAAELVDQAVERLRRLLQPGDRLLLILDPGRTGRGPGLLLAAGDGVLPGDGPELAAGRVLATILWLGGLPAPAGQAPATDLLTPEAAAQLPLRTVPGFGPPPPAGEGTDDAGDAGTREYLRSLGYID